MWPILVALVSGFGMMIGLKFTANYLNKTPARYHSDLEPIMVKRLKDALLAFALTRVLPKEVPDLDPHCSFEQACFDYFADPSTHATVQDYALLHLDTLDRCKAFFKSFIDFLIDDEDEQMTHVSTCEDVSPPPLTTTPTTQPQDNPENDQLLHDVIQKLPSSHEVIPEEDDLAECPDVFVPDEPRSL
jgi:putative component of membrane protein insertase Oxa1/YidC/SpoIIIJ protein YidD